MLVNKLVKIKKIFKNVVKAVNYAHLMNVSHRDLKLDNILINGEGVVKLIDFGFAVYRKDPKQLIQNFCGTPTYMSPEIIKREAYDPNKADIWALGVLIYKLVVGRYPFKGKDDKELYSKITSASFRIPKGLPVELSILFEKIFVIDPQERISAVDILLCEWFD